MLDQIKGKLVISCQALPGEPLHSPMIMGRMAIAAKNAGSRHSRTRRSRYY